MRRTTPLIAIALLVSVAAASGQAIVAPDDPATLLGLTPAQAIERFGPPGSVFAIRGAEPWQDDVVFDYGGGFSLFLFKDRVWQVRIAEPYARPVLGLVVGSGVERAISALGAPALALGGSYEWVLPGEAWPVRLRGVTDGGRIRELYIYRADF
ncbi:MAG TPA: hypothetical protein PLW80_07855 [Spirochaetales bacterium]|nr:hypothetical protein [Spirochaetales bacterium]